MCFELYIDGVRFDFDAHGQPACANSGFAWEPEHRWSGAWSDAGGRTISVDWREGGRGQFRSVCRQLSWGATPYTLVLRLEHGLFLSFVRRPYRIHVDMVVS